MGSQQGVTESGRHLPWATVICNHDQSSDLSAGSLVVSLLKALLFWMCSSPSWGALWAVTQEESGDSAGWRLTHAGTRAGYMTGVSAGLIDLRKKRPTSSPALPTGHYLSLVMVSDFLLPHCVLWMCFIRFLQTVKKILHTAFPCAFSDIQPLTFFCCLLS